MPILVICAVIACPIITLILFLYSLGVLIMDKSELNRIMNSGDFDNTEQIIIKEHGLREDIEKQKARMIVTGVLGVISWSIIVAIIIYIISILNGEISIM